MADTDSHFAVLPAGRLPASRHPCAYIDEKGELWSGTAGGEERSRRFNRQSVFRCRCPTSCRFVERVSTQPASTSWQLVGPWAWRCIA